MHLSRLPSEIFLSDSNKMKKGKSTRTKRTGEESQETPNISRFGAVEKQMSGT